MPNNLKSSPVIHRRPNNPILTAQDIPYGPLLVFNVGVTRYQGQYVMAFRNDGIFPCGMVLEDSGEVKIYYGAVGTVTCLATADVDDLIRLCRASPDQ